MRPTRTTFNHNSSIQGERLPGQHNFVAKNEKHSFNERTHTCEASALTAELTAQNRSYFTSKIQLCKTGALASSKNGAGLGELLHLYALFAATEDHSRHSIAIVRSSVRYLERFLAEHGASSDAAEISHLEIRAFILYLKQKRCY